MARIDLITQLSFVLFYFMYEALLLVYCEGGANFLLIEMILYVSSSWDSLSLRNENLKMWCQAKSCIKFCQALSLSRSRCSPQLC